MPKSRKKKRPPKRVLALPDLEQSKTAVLNRVTSKRGHQTYDRAILFRSINKSGRVWGKGMNPKVLWEVVREAASRAGIGKLAPHDLRRTCARLCHLAGGNLLASTSSAHNARS